MLRPFCRTRAVSFMIYLGGGSRWEGRSGGTEKGSGRKDYNNQDK